jgi:signal transduction histidine kinase
MGLPYVSRNVRHDPYYVQDPRLKETYAELAAPIFARGEVVGVLDVQSIEPGAFDEADTVALRALAVAVGVAMENARLFRRIRADEHQLLAIIDAVPSPLGVYDTSWHAILANRAMAEVYGADYHPQNLTAGASENGPLPERRKQRRGPTNPPLFDHTREEEIRLTNPHRTFIRRVTPVAVAGETTALVVLDQDVTAERAALRAKDQLLSIAAHEPRTPMTALLGFLKLVQQQLNTNDPDLSLVGHRLSIIRREARRIAALIEELLDLAQLEAGSARLRPVEVDAVVLLQRIGERFGTMPGADRLRIELIAAPPTCVWDDGRIEQILTNLVDNALKYAPPPSEVVLSLQVMEGEQARFEVRDMGPGISVTELATLFRPFARGESSGRVGGGLGLGLGLYVSRVFAERHGGHLWLESTPGAGTTAVLSLPFRIDVIELMAFTRSA